MLLHPPPLYQDISPSFRGETGTQKKKKKKGLPTHISFRFAFLKSRSISSSFLSCHVLPAVVGTSGTPRGRGRTWRGWASFLLLVAGFEDDGGDGGGDDVAEGEDGDGDVLDGGMTGDCWSLCAS